MRARRVLPVLLVLATVAVGATGCFESKVASTTISGEITVGEGTTARRSMNPAAAAGGSDGSTAREHRRATGERPSASHRRAVHGSEHGTTTGGGSGADLAAGKTSFTATCGGCHTLKDAGTTGNVGPDLDSLAPLTAERVAKQIENGGGPMPPKLLTGKDADERRRLRGVGRRQVERSVPGAPAVLQLPPGLDARAVRAVAMDLDGTVLDETFQPSARTAAAIATRRGRRHRLPDRDRAHVRLGAAHRREARHPATARLLPGRARGRSRSAARCSCTGRSRRRWRARSCARCPSEHARRSNLYIDDELYVWEENEATLRYSQVAGVEMHIVGPLADWIERPTTKIVTVGRPEEMDVLRDELQPLFGSRAFIAKSLPYFLEFAAPGVSKASGLALLADLLGFTRRAGGRGRRRRERPRDARLGGLRPGRRERERAAQGRGRRRDPVGARRRRRAAARGARRCTQARLRSACSTSA